MSMMHAGLNRLMKLSLLLVLAGLCGCQAISDLAGADTVVDTIQPALPDNAQLDTLLAYTEWLAKQPPTSLRTTYQQAQARFDASGEVLDSVNLALLLSVPGTGFQNDTKARTYLQNALTRAPMYQPGIKRFIRLQLANLEFRQQALATSAQQIAEQQRKLEIQQQQINDLKSIEKGLIKRQEPPKP